MNLDLKADTVSRVYKRFGDQSYHISGAPGKNKAIYQKIIMSGTANDTFEVSGWTKATGNLNPSGHFGFNIGIHYTDGTWKWVTKDSNPEAHMFEFMEMETKPDKSYDYVLIYALFYNQPAGSHAWFDGIRFNRNPSFNRLIYRVSQNDADSSEFANLYANVVVNPYIETKPADQIDEWMRSIPSKYKIMFPLASRGQGYESDASHYMWLKGSDGKYRFNRSLAKEMIEKYDRKTQIVYWYLYDEPLASQVTNAELKAAYDYVKSLSSKSIGVAYSNGKDFGYLGYGNNHSDFLLFSFYPYKAQKYVYSTDTTDHCAIEREWRAMGSDSKSTKPWYGVVQAFGRAGSDYFEPTSEQIKLQAREYKSLGAGGIAYFSFSSDNGYSDTYQHIYNREDWRRAINEVNYEWLTGTPY